MVMNKISKSLGFIMMMLAVFTTFSCSSSDDDKTSTLESLAGDYTGWTSAAFKYSSTPLATDNEKLKIAFADGKVSLQLTSNQWGTATVSDVTVTEQGNEYKLTGSGSASLGMHSGQAQQYDCTLAGTISKDKKTVNVVLTYPAVMGGTTVTFTLGEAPAANLVAGSYSGWTKGDCAYFKNYNQNDEKVSISCNENGDGTVDVKLTSQKWGETTISGVKVEKTTDGFTLSGSGKFAMSMGGAASEYDCTLTGTISADKATYSIVFNLPSVMGGLTITFAQGEAPSAE